MPSIIEFNGKKYDSVTGRILSGHSKLDEQISAKEVLKPATKNIDGVNSKPAHSPSHHPRKTADRKHRVEKPKTLMRSSVKKSQHKPVLEHKASERIGLYHELTRERARRAKYVQRSTSIAKFSKTAPKKRSDTQFRTESLAVSSPPTHARHSHSKKSVDQTKSLVGKLDEAVQSAESHLEVFEEKKLKSKKSRRLAYGLASLTSVALIGFAVYQAVPFVQVKLASNKAGFSATLPGYTPSGYGLENNLQSGRGVVTMTYSSQAESKNYEITQTPSRWNSDSLLRSYVMPASSEYERIEQNGRTIYVYDGQKSATWLDGGIWYRLDGANNFSNDQLLRIVQGL